MKSKQFTVLLMTAAVMVTAPHLCLANISVECGQGLNTSDGTLRSRQFLISSESDRLAGTAGRSWHLYDAQNLEIRDATLDKKPSGDLVLAIGARASGSAKNQLIYIIKRWGDDSFTTAALIANDGPTEQSPGESLQCVVSQD